VKVGFLEAEDFTPAVNTYFGGDEHYRKLQEALGENPEIGPVIPGTSGLRKVRWPDPRRGKGKRGGLRVIYMHVPLVHQIVFLDVYDKNQADDLTTEQKKELAEIADTIRRNLLEREKERLA
jgi:hypothetical protein